MKDRRDIQAARWRLCAGRWLSMVFLGLSGTSFFLLTNTLLHPIIEPIIEQLAFLSRPVIALVFAFGLFPGVWIMGKDRWRGFCGLKYFLRYPPLWVAVVVGMFFLILIRPEMDGPREFVALGADCLSFTTRAIADCLSFATRYIIELSVGSAIVIFLIVATTRHLSHDSADTSSETNGGKVERSPLLGDFDSIVRWLKDDRPIDEPSQALFGHPAVAARIARRLSTASSDDPPTIALVGDYGSGKTTIRRLVQYNLSAEERIRVVPLSLWAFHSAEAAVAGILRALVLEVSRHVNVLGVRGLSEEYVSAIAGAAGWWSAFLRLMTPRENPESIIRRISDIARCIGLSLVLWVEDLERFSGADVLHEDQAQASLREAERLGPIRALLFLLDQCPAISVVLADTSLQSRFDLNKISRYVERAPRVEATTFWELLKPFRDECMHQGHLVDPAQPKTRTAMEPSHSTLSMGEHVCRLDPNKPRFHEAFALLLTTPRSVKDALRTTYEVWNTLAGEIDLDDVIIMSVIRTIRPKIFTFIEDHIDLFRRGFRTSLREGDGTKHPKYVEFEDFLLKEQREETRNCIRELLSAVFPMPKEGHHHDVDRDYIQKPQGLAINRHADNWMRFLAIPEIPDTHSDQRAIRDISDWKEGDTCALIERIVDSERSEQVETFVRLFSSQELIRLLREVVAKICVREDFKRSDFGSAEPIISVWCMMHRRQPDNAKLCQATCELICDIMKRNLSFVHDLCYYVGGARSENVPPLLSDESRARVREVLERELVHQFKATEPADLVRAIHGAHPYLLFWLCWGQGREDVSGEITPFARWSEFAAILLDAASVHPADIVPLILPFVMHETRRRENRMTEDDMPTTVVLDERTFVEKAAKKLFDFDQLVKILRSDFDSSRFEDMSKSQLKAALDSLSK